MMKTLTLTKFDSDFMLHYWRINKSKCHGVYSKIRNKRIWCGRCQWITPSHRHWWSIWWRHWHSISLIVIWNNRIWCGRCQWITPNHRNWWSIWWRHWHWISLIAIIYSTIGVLTKLSATVFIQRYEITESDVEDANESHQTIDTHGVYDEEIDTD